MKELLQAIAAADVGVVVVKRNVCRDLTHCNTTFDFIAMRRPAIVSRTRSWRPTSTPSCFLLFESGDEHDLARAIRTLCRDPALGDRLVRRAAERSEPSRWSRQRDLEQRVVERVMA
jgi:glycosyltransferase involved in cell wall biosynthesis